ncbi:MAG TPA: ATP-binding protein [Geobacteraceae bacterium]
MRQFLLKTFWPKRIVLRVAIMTSALIVLTLGLFAAAAIPYQRTAILDAMKSEAKSTVTSIDQVTATAIITEDFGTVVEHCLRVVKESPTIVYVVVTRADGFSLVITKKGWRQENLGGVWTPQGPPLTSSRFLNSSMASEEVYHYTHPFKYSGFDWGWIHIGLSLEKFHADIRSMYLRTALLALLCITMGILVAHLFAQKLTQPISILDITTQQVARGDLTARAEIRTGDELERLARSFNEMTETLRKSREEITSARDTAETASRAKSQFLANMSHEIRTPMNGVLGMLDLLLDSNMSDEQLRLAMMAYSSAENLLSVINDILDFSKIEAGKLELQPDEIRVRDMIKEVSDLFWIKAQKKDIRLLRRMDGRIPDVVEGDPVRLRQILVNLMGNAVKFTEQGEVSLEAQLGAKTDEEVVLRFRVRDTGVGIPADAQWRIFDAFSQADDSMARRHEGTGLGLAISRQLVGMMGGEIGVESMPGKGSLFWFTVRLRRVERSMKDIGDRVETELVAGEDTGRRQLSVLLAEDNPVNQELGRLILEDLGCRVTVVDDGRAAVEKVFRDRYDMVFMDCQMPEVDGYEATRMIRERETEGSGGTEMRVPIIALTAHAMEGDRELCLAVGMDDYISKPFKANQIGAVIDKWSRPGAG